MGASRPVIWRPSSRAVTMRMLDHELSRDCPSIVHFWASWNNVDKLMDAAIESLKSEFDRQVNFLCLDTGPKETWEFCRACRVLNLPALGFYEMGVHVDTLVGLRERDVLATVFRGWINGEGRPVNRTE